MVAQTKSPPGPACAFNAPPPPQSQNHIDGENDSNQSKVMQEFYGEGLGIGPTKASPPSKGCYVKVKNQDLFYLVVNLTL